MSDRESMMDDAMWDNIYEDEAKIAHENWQEEIIDDFVRDITLSFFANNEDILSISYTSQDEAKKILNTSPSSAILFTYTAIETAIKHAILKPMIYGMTHNENVANLIVNKFLQLSNVDAYTSITFKLVDELIQLDLSNAKTHQNKLIIKETENLAKKRNNIIHSGRLYEKDDALEALKILDDLYHNVIIKMLNHINFTISEKKIIKI
jgi:hypothetical protein